jgi:hypothetical protein
MDEGPVAAMEEARDAGAAWSCTPARAGQRAATRHHGYFARNWRDFTPVPPRRGFSNGSQLFGWVAEQGLRPVAAMTCTPEYPG